MRQDAEEHGPERIRPQSVEPPLPDLTAAPRAVPDLEPAGTVIALGTSCVPGWALRRLGLNDAPMPFDWLATDPAMIRHCLQTDFSVLLNPSHYRSLTGHRGPSEPAEGCAHDFYAREYGLACVFNHNDPTRPADYRYLAACVDRFRDAMAHAAPKLFVQVRDAYGGAGQDFEANTALLDGLTRNARLLQLVVNPPGPPAQPPTFHRLAERGAHALIRMQPGSRMTGEVFVGSADNAALDDLITRSRVAGPAGAAPARVAAPPPVALGEALATARLTAHVADRGDVGPDGTGWTGEPGSGLAVQGVVIHSERASVRADLRYAVAEAPGRFSASVPVGQYAGTRGQGLPVYGVRIETAHGAGARLRLSLEASFLGEVVERPADLLPCQVSSDRPLEALRLLVTEA